MLNIFNDECSKNLITFKSNGILIISLKLQKILQKLHYLPEGIEIKYFAIHCVEISAFQQLKVLLKPNFFSSNFSK